MKRLVNFSRIPLLRLSLSWLGERELLESYLARCLNPNTSGRTVTLNNQNVGIRQSDGCHFSINFSVTQIFLPSFIYIRNEKGGLDGKPKELDYLFNEQLISCKQQLSIEWTQRMGSLNDDGILRNKATSISGRKWGFVSLNQGFVVYFVLGAHLEGATTICPQLWASNQSSLAVMICLMCILSGPTRI